MSPNISVKLAPALTAERWDDPKWMRPGRTFYGPGSLKLVSPPDHPIVIDHDMSRVIGAVDELFTMDWTDGPWIAARGVIDDRWCSDTHRPRHLPPRPVRHHTP